MASYIRINTAEDFNATTPAEGYVLLFVDTSSGKPVLLVKDSTGAVNEISGSGGSGSGIQPGVITEFYNDIRDSVFARPIDPVTGMYSGNAVLGTLGYWPDPINNAAAPFGAPSSAEPTLEEWPWDVIPTPISSDPFSVFYGPHFSVIPEPEFNNGDSITYGNNVGFVSPWFYCLYMKPESLAAGYNPTSVTIEGSVDSSVWNVLVWSVPGSATPNPLDASNYFDTVVYGADGNRGVDLKCIKLRVAASGGSDGTMNDNVRNSYRYFRLTFGTDRSDGIIKLALISAAARS